MEKVKLTQEQAKAIEYALSKTNDYEGDKDRLLRDISRDYVNFHNDLFPLNKIDIAVAAKALYVGYDVIPRYKVGDWVVRTVDRFGSPHEKGRIFQIKAIGDHHGDVIEQGGIVHKCESVRRAVKEEIQQEEKRRLFKKLGRKEDEYHQYDIAWDTLTDTPVEVDDPDQVSDSSVYRVADLSDKCNSRERLPEDLCLICPADKRLDR